MIYCLSICAGKQSRFKCDTPKALMDIDGKTLIRRNYENAAPYIDKFLVVCSVENQLKFATKNKIVISSGKGSGDAVWQALSLLPLKQGDTCFILWGDCLQEEDVFKKLKNSYTGVSLIPCVKEEKPYVQIIEDGNGVSVKFSKFNESISAGFHDLSVFYCDAVELLKQLNTFHDKIFHDGHYQHKHGNEMEFLDVFNDTDMSAKVLEFKNHKDFSFNTIEQFEQMLDDYKKEQTL